MTETKQRRAQKPQLRVVFDTNVLYTGSASDLVRQEVATLIKESVFPDLEIQWYLPEMVRHERQYQMQKRALELMPSITKVEKLLGHNLAITEQTLMDGVEKAITERQRELGFIALPLDYGKVDWNQLALDAVYRRPPFQDGDKEKGFRDRLIVEGFLQLVADSPKTPNVCRVALISGDGLVVQAVQEKNTESKNMYLFSTLEELKGLINTLVSQVDEAFLAVLRPKAEKLFFVPKDDSTLLYRENIQQKLKEKFEKELEALPQGATGRRNGTWTVNPPNFVHKTGKRIQWASRISIEAEAWKPQLAVSGQSTAELITGSTLAGRTQISTLTGVEWKPTLRDMASNPAIGGSLPEEWLAVQYPNLWIGSTPANRVTTHKGVDVYEVLWSVDVTTNRDLRRPAVDEIRHLNATWEQVT